MMPKNKMIHLRVIKEIAKALGELNEKVAFVGGAVVCIYANDPAAEDVRPTKDVDITLQLGTYSDLIKITEELSEKKFYPAKDEKVICRFQYKDILVDVMSTKEIGWAPANIWFKPGFDHLETVDIDEVSIKILPFSYFLATKFSAFKSRGTDPRTSHDFEDIVYLLDNRTTLVDDILSSPMDLKLYLQNELNDVLIDAVMQEAVLSHLPYEIQTDRYRLLKQKLEKIIK